jgi:predicted GNAT superfamily acetyltransferase
MENGLRVLLRFRDHYCSVLYIDDRIHCFKYSNQGCDFDVFDDLDSAAEYALCQPKFREFSLDLDE